jgi:arginine decarboxylase
MTKRMEVEDKTNIVLSKPILYVPKIMFLTKGKGLHKDYLTSFELALRDAEIADLNLVAVSSIKPPQCKIYQLT